MNMTITDIGTIVGIVATISVGIVFIGRYVFVPRNEAFQSFQSKESCHLIVAEMKNTLKKIENRLNKIEAQNERFLITVTKINATVNGDSNG